ncbi:hypothetical protein FGO68_gene8937 [Halteria grandinella]|uniref:Uncharacterized protein n=1 Tax=Halteria grandinella TaxID=5974 RepID=A0A8J8NSW0_HALGN|nr:hypothetical protein FGO68_gene8937 [Halteria grandinella]
MKQLISNQALFESGSSYFEAFKQTMNYVTLVQSFILTTTYLIFLIYVVRAVKSHVFGRLSLVYLSTLTCYVCRLALDSFTIVYQLEEGPTDQRSLYMIYALKLTNNLAEKARDLLFIYFIYQVQEVRIKIEAENVQQLKSKLKSHQVQYKVIFILMFICASLIFLSHIFLYQEYEGDFIHRFPETARKILISQIGVRMIDIVMEFYLAYFVIWKNFAFFMRKHVEKSRQLSVGLDFAGLPQRKQSCCRTCGLLETKKEKAIVCLVVSNYQLLNITGLWYHLWSCRSG